MIRNRNAFFAAVRLSDEERLLISHIDDMIRICEKRRCARFTGFLSEREAALSEDYLGYTGFENYMLYGGYEDAQRVVLGVFGQSVEPDKESFPVRTVRFACRSADSLTHRDYLGSLMSLGIERSLVGDIVCGGENAYAMLSPAAAELAVMSITKIGRTGVKCTLSDGSESIVRCDSFAVITGTVSSLRLDCVLSTALRLSRDKTAQLIRSGAVSVNHSVTEGTASAVKDGDILSVKGYGRFILDKTGDRTKKDRIHVTIKKYV